MPTRTTIVVLAALITVVFAPAFAGQGLKPAPHGAFAGAFASSVNPGKAHVNPVQQPANNNLNADYMPTPCLDFGISLDLPTRCWGHGL
jgi:hypothetical protein